LVSFSKKTLKKINENFKSLATTAFLLSIDEGTANIAQAIGRCGLFCCG
jgi:hypothetical protein